jgi:glycosyltransferase involved in cell wall biosynthesis
LKRKILAIANHAVMLGGGEHSFLDLLSHLPSDWQPDAAVPHEGELTGRLKQRGIETHTLPLPRIRPWALVRILASVNAYLRLCKKLRPALIYANGSRAALYGSVTGAMLGVPIIWHCRIAEPDPYLDPLLTKLSTVIIANSKATASRFTPHSQPKIKVVYNGVDLPWLQDSNVKTHDLIGEQEKIILTVARATKMKRHDLVLSAFEQVAKYDSRVCLVCIGTKDEWELDWWEYLQEMTRQSPFARRIHWVGKVEDVRPWYRQASILVLVSENESFGRVIVEAMACGVPVIAARSGGIPEIIRHQQDGLLVAPGNVEELQAALTSLLRDQSIRERYAKSALGRAERFSLDSHVVKMVEIFENILTPGRLAH